MVILTVFIIIFYNFIICQFAALFQEYEETCLFIIARISESDSPRVYPNILKTPPPFASSDGYPASGVRYERVGLVSSASHCLILDILATARGRVIFRSHFLISPFVFYSYISSYSSLILPYTVILLLCDHRVRIFQQRLVDAEGYIHFLDLRCLGLPTLKWPPTLRPR